jgi:predicted dinucleotide-binding enzyme
MAARESAPFALDIDAPANLKIIPNLGATPTVIDATNAFGVLPEELDGLPSSAFVAKAFTGVKLVKSFNHL